MLPIDRVQRVLVRFLEMTMFSMSVFKMKLSQTVFLHVNSVTYFPPIEEEWHLMHWGL